MLCVCPVVLRLVGALWPQRGEDVARRVIILLHGLHRRQRCLGRHRLLRVRLLRLVVDVIIVKALKVRLDAPPQSVVLDLCLEQKVNNVGRVPP
jgi:hypothetical protein